MRPLGIPTWSDKLLQEVMRRLLDAYYEPQFTDFSHGFRPGRGCHTALHRIYNLHSAKGILAFRSNSLHKVGVNACLAGRILPPAATPQLSISTLANHP